MIFPTLYDTSKNGKVKQWSIYVNEIKDYAGIFVEHGYIDGKKQIAEEYVYEGKNIGKSNATTAFEQACAQAKSTWQHKKDKGSVESVDAAKTKPVEELPMLAHKFSERYKEIKFPCAVQPKLNGFRCLAKKVAEDKIEFKSRGGKFYTTLGHIEAALLSHIEVGCQLDGELYIHGKSFEEIASAVKKTNSLTPFVEYHVYDIASSKSEFNQRSWVLRELVSVVESNSIVYVETSVVESVEDVHAAHKEFSARGYEGTMIRNLHGLYMYKHRSVDLLKMKDFQDAEFKIVGCKMGTPGTSLDECAIFQCEVSPGKTFDVVCEGGRDLNKQQWIERDSYMGQLLNVRFQNYSDAGIPIFPVGTSIREAWDL